MNAAFRLEANMRSFAPADTRGVLDYAPEALMLPLADALRLADARLNGEFELPSLRSAIVVLTSMGAESLDEPCRDQLWRAFGLPVFEQLCGPDRRVVAWECEVHDGLHFDPPTSQLDLSERADIVSELCECGNPTPRLRLRAPILVRAAAA